MKPSLRLALLAAGSLGGLLAGYVVIFTFYVAGLFGDGSAVSVKAWERTLRGTILMGPLLAGFLLLGLLAWRERWTTGLLPWATGALAVVFLARWDAGILTTADYVLGIGLLVAAGVAGHNRLKAADGPDSPRRGGGDDGEPPADE